MEPNASNNCNKRKRNEIITVAPKQEECANICTEGDTTNCTAATEAISNHLVLKQVLTNLDTGNLLRFSLVNKLWCSTARSLLRSKKCLASIKGLHPCQELLRLNTTLLNSQDVPYTGLNLELNQQYTRYLDPSDLGEHAFDRVANDESEGEESDEEEDNSPEISQVQSSQQHPELLNHISIQANFPQCYSSILEKLPFRHLEFQWDHKSNSCPAQGLLIKILREKRTEILELVIHQVPDTIRSLRRYLRIKEFHWLPALTLLDVRSLERDSQSIHFKYELMQAAPKLKALNGSSSINDIEFFLDNQKVQVSHTFDCNFDPMLFIREDHYGENRTLIQYAISKPNITAINVMGPFDDCEAIPDTIVFMRNFLTPLLQDCSTLTKIKLDQIHLMLMLPNTTRLVNVKRMHLFMNESLDNSSGFKCLQRFDWNKSFPNLDLIEFSTAAQTDCYLEHWPVQEIMLRRPEFVCSSVTKVLLFLSDIDFDGLGYWKELFPNVRHFFNISPSRIERMLRFLWVTWPKLETIALHHVFDTAVSRNLDSAFCGISPEEVDRLLKAESLDGVELEPSGPSILGLKNLKRLHVSMSHRGASNMPKEHCAREQQNKAHLFFATHLTGKLAFGKVPGLEVRIERDVCEQKEDSCAYTFDHLRPYVTLASKGK